MKKVEDLRTQRHACIFIDNGYMITFYVRLHFLSPNCKTFVQQYTFGKQTEKIYNFHFQGVSQITP